jgi:acyl transferase domain-containing protein
MGLLGSIGDIAGFDSVFFGVSPQETERMSPEAWVLLERANGNRANYPLSHAGVRPFQ